jgi:hypothetical protein
MEFLLYFYSFWGIVFLLFEISIQHCAFFDSIILYFLLKSIVFGYIDIFKILECICSKKETLCRLFLKAKLNF